MIIVEDSVVYGIALVQNNIGKMKGFEIKINEEIITVASDRVVCVFFHFGDGYEIINVSGSDSKSYHSIWFEKKLQIGDKINVRVAEIDIIPPPIEKCPFDRNELKKRYIELKKELEAEGLI